jgi:hypothetical protein
MSEPTKLSIEEILGIPIETKAGFYIADDPALAQWKRKSDLYDADWTALRDEMEGKYRETIEVLKEQCVKHAEEAQKLLRSDDELVKALEELVAIKDEPLCKPESECGRCNKERDLRARISKLKEGKP